MFLSYRLKLWKLNVVGPLRNKYNVLTTLNAKRLLNRWKVFEEKETVLAFFFFRETKNLGAADLTQ